MNKNSPVQKKPKSQLPASDFKLRAKKAGKVSAFIAKSTIWYPLKVVLKVLWKCFTYIINIFFTCMLVGIITGVVVACAFVLYIQNYIDADYEGLDNLKFDSSLNTTICYVDSDGKEVVMEGDTLYSGENRLWADYNEIPQRLIDAVICIEDQRFYEHKGVDIKRTVGAVLNFFLPGGDSYGGSTLTQQLIKNVSQDDETTIQRKVQEIFRALNVETKFEKAEILEMYLNVIYLSQNTNGVKAAAEAYFGKQLSELTLLECAALAAIPKYPTYYDPIRNPDNNLKRRNLILKEMLNQEIISKEEFDQAYNVPLYISSDTDGEYTETIHSYYVDAVIDDVISALMERYSIDKTTASRKLYSGGLTIVTNLDPDIQSAMEEVFENDSCFPKVTGIKPQAAMSIIDPYGNVKGIVGGRGEKTTSRGLNRATQSKRQCGSSIKPLSIYALAMEKGIIDYGSALEDTPSTFDQTTKTYWPGNTPAGFNGIVPLTFAVQKSLNTTAVRLAEAIGVSNCFDFLTTKCGFTTLVESKSYGGSIKTDIAVSPMALGSFTEGVTVMEVSQAYTMFPNGGNVSMARTFSMVRDSNGQIIIDNRGDDNETYAISEGNAYVMTQILKSVVSSAYGTAYSAFKNYRTFDSAVEVAGKTGSTNDDRDRYFVGYTPDYVASVWFGYDSNKSLSKMSYNPATRLWIEVMNRVYANLAEKRLSYKRTFEQPYGIVKVQYCTISGCLATDACKADLETVLTGKSKVATGYFTLDTAPREYCTCHTMVKWDKDTQAICLDHCYCPESSLIDVALRKITPRTFYTNLKVADSQYTYLDPALLGSNYIMPTANTVPYFWNYYTIDTWPGRSSTSSGFAPYNRICSEHYSLIPPEDVSDNPEESSVPWDSLPEVLE